ncbi:MAG: PUA domain-containing protein [Pseudanabaena sp.]
MAVKTYKLITIDIASISIVAHVDLDGKEIARSITNYSSNDIVRILGSQSDDIRRLLGFDGEETVVHRDNLVSVAN